jgi:hypothetical protein
LAPDEAAEPGIVVAAPERACFNTFGSSELDVQPAAYGLRQPIQGGLKIGGALFQTSRSPIEG